MATNELNSVESYVEEAAKLIKRVQNLLNYPIMATPSGPQRNKITDANVHLGAARQILEDLSLAPVVGRVESKPDES